MFYINFWSIYRTSVNENSRYLRSQRNVCLHFGGVSVVSVLVSQNHQDLPGPHVRRVEPRQLVVQPFHLCSCCCILWERVLVHCALQEFFAAPVREILGLVPVLDLSEADALEDSLVLCDILRIVEVTLLCGTSNVKLDGLFSQAFLGKILKMEK